MGELINGRTPEEIKRWVDGGVTCNTCPKGHEVGCEYGERTKDCQMSIDTIAYIERLESERDAALAKVPRWISVEERLPEKPGEYGAYASGMHLVLGFDENGDWFDEEYFNYNESITHWMPLPNPPKE